MQLTLMQGKELGYKLECERLGTMLQGDGGCDKEVTRRLALARVKYNGLMWLWHDCKVSMGLKMRIYESNVLSIVVRGSEGWLLGADGDDREEAQRVERPLPQPHHGQDCT